jgi:hypothetical protein
LLRDKEIKQSLSKKMKVVVYKYQADEKKEDNQTEEGKG